MIEEVAVAEVVELSDSQYITLKCFSLVILFAVILFYLKFVDSLFKTLCNG